MDGGNQRTYEFISDPTHKINLSGRVSAACANCRKKKIKCDGTNNCRQCREKNLECVPAPTRKRPKRDRHISAGEASSSTVTAAGLALTDSAPAASSSRQTYREPGAQTASRPSINPQQSRTPSDDAKSGAEPSSNASSSSAEQRISRSISPLDSSVAAFARPRLDATRGPAAGRPTLQDSRSARRAEWPAHRGAPDVFPGGVQGHQGTPHSAARAFEDEAHSLRQLASSRDGFTHPNNAPVAPQEPPRGPYLGSTEQQRFAMGPPEQNLNFRSGLLLSEYSQWWDTQSAAAPYQPAGPSLPTTQAGPMSFPEHPPYRQTQQRHEDQPDQQDPPWSRRA
ncbi:hypothetical protein EJ03DRAFT_68555 [Teratosphaeria nubilosa]|uniref:Zn(2)-C6 fungal-type domain-containing protein n=1 Tax=Teratosphaeria nubilosa TaxID=161662 RepID=A0A6G1KSL9_9PEZI|nr:hypothetical protein EJ03DRAFT_68555 [Teratosphaeria nubilosa]